MEEDLEYPFRHPKWSQSPGNIEELDEYTLLQRFVSSYRPPRKRSVTAINLETALWANSNGIKASSNTIQHPNNNARAPPTANRIFLMQPNIFKAGHRQLLYVLEKTVNGEPLSNRVVLNIAALQRMVLQDLQQNIAVYVGSLKNHEEVFVKREERRELADLLHSYTNAVRDLDFMRECAKRGLEGDPFLLMTSREMEWQAMKRANILPETLDQLLAVSEDTRDPLLFGASPPRNYTNRKSARKQQLAGFLMAVFGSLALILPMIVMVLVPGKTTSIAVTSVCTIGFAAILAVVSKLDPEKILGVTAAYSAVLVVFVGASLAPNQ